MKRQLLRQQGHANNRTNKKKTPNRISITDCFFVCQCMEYTEYVYTFTSGRTPNLQTIFDSLHPHI